MLTAYKTWHYAPLAILVVCGLSTAISAQLISFSYSQTDTTTGGGTFSGTVDGILFTGEMPLATVSQNDTSNLEVPEGMIGYMDGQANPSTNGNDFGVHLGWDGSVTLTGEKVVSATELELYELELNLIIADDGTPDADWSYSAVVTDDDGKGNDAFGQFRMAAWIGEPRNGHRHSGATNDFLRGAVDNHVMGGTHGQVDADGRGDKLGIAFSFRDGVDLDTGEDMEDGPFTNGSGPVYVDSIVWNGGLTATNTPNLLGTSLAADFNLDDQVDMADFAILASSFNLDGTTRSGGGDMTGDGRTDLRDWALFREALLAAPGTAVAVPEPSTALSLLLGSLCLAALRRARRANPIRSGSAA